MTCLAKSRKDENFKLECNGFHCAFLLDETASLEKKIRLVQILAEIKLRDSGSKQNLFFEIRKTLEKNAQISVDWVQTGLAIYEKWDKAQLAKHLAPAKVKLIIFVQNYHRKLGGNSKILRK